MKPMNKKRVSELPVIAGAASLLVLSIDSSVLANLYPQGIEGNHWVECTRQYKVQIRLYNSKSNSSREIQCVDPRSFIQTRYGGRVKYIDKSEYNVSGYTSRFGAEYFHETNCDSMESRSAQVVSYALKSPGLSKGTWRYIDGQPYAIGRKQNRFSQWKIIRYVRPIDKWICDNR